MSETTTTIKVRGTLDGPQQRKLQVNLEIKIPLRPLAAMLMSLVPGNIPTQPDVDGLVKQMKDD